MFLDMRPDQHQNPEGVLQRQAPSRDHAGLNQDQVDLKAGTIRLKSSETKTDKGRLIPLNQTLTSALKTATRYVRCPWVFVSQTIVDLWQADPEQVDPHYHATSVTHAFERACHTSGVSHATFHDLRHIFVTDARCAGIDYFRIMTITGHKMIAVFKRYNRIDQRDLPGDIRQLDTYMDTTDVEAPEAAAQSIDNSSMGR
jgi:integrase